LTPNEYELLQTVPIDYTAGISDSARRTMLGEGWTVDIIAHIFRYIKNTPGNP
jgi:DNA (cytosine-5)-methyltransferase 3A